MSSGDSDPSQVLRYASAMAVNDPPNPYEYQNFGAYPAPPQDEGSFGLGVALGAIFGLWGMLGTLFFAKSETKRGARYGFAGRLLLTFILVCASAGLRN